MCFQVAYMICTRCSVVAPHTCPWASQDEIQVTLTYPGLRHPGLRHPGSDTCYTCCYACLLLMAWPAGVPEFIM
jgi:hypothetical protein